MNVAVVSLNPLGRKGGSERFTLGAIQSIRAHGDRCEAFAVRDLDAADESSQGRAFVHTFDAHGERELAFKEVLGLLAGFDVVWVHQYLASELLFDILGVVPDPRTVLLTNLGDEQALRQFTSRYKQGRHHRFVHPAEFLAAPGRSARSASVVLPAGIWCDFIGSTNAVEREPGQICALDGVSAGSGLETTIRALPAGCSLVVVGAPARDAAYLRVVGSAVAGREVYFTGEVPETRRRTVLAGSEILVAGHTPVHAQGGTAVTAPFVSTVLLEALGCDTLPVAPDIAPHLEVMSSLGLSDFVFPAGNHEALRRLMERILTTPHEEIAMRKAQARARIRQSWLWDDYWFRIRRELQLEGPEPDERHCKVRTPVPGVRPGAAGYLVGGHTLNWKAFQV